jgi:hypothetical protein
MALKSNGKHVGNRFPAWLSRHHHAISETMPLARLDSQEMILRWRGNTTTRELGIGEELGTTMSRTPERADVQFCPDIFQRSCGVTRGLGATAQFIHELVGEYLLRDGM